MRNKTILVTGANGFVGRSLSRELLSVGYNLVPITRSDLGLTDAMCGVDTVVHLAARVHVMRDTCQDMLVAYRTSNVTLTKQLLELSIKAKVRRFIFVSSAHVNGTESLLRPFEEKDLPKPSSDYAISKYEAEKCLNDMSKRGDIEIVIIRPPLVYGPYVKANFLNALKLARTGLPLPIGMLHNKRSMVSLNNLVNFIIHCIEHKKAPNETFFVSDDHDISTKELFAQLMHLFGKRALLLPVPPKILDILGTLLNRREIISRLCSTLQVDISKAKTMLEWRPIQTFENGLEQAVAWYKKEYL